MNLKEIRKTAGITQRQLADEAGVNVRWLQKIENGEIAIENITFVNATKLLAALSKYEPDKTISETFSMARSVYYAMRYLIGEQK